MQMHRSLRSLLLFWVSLLKNNDEALTKHDIQHEHQVWKEGVSQQKAWPPVVSCILDFLWQEFSFSFRDSKSRLLRDVDARNDWDWDLLLSSFTFKTREMQMIDMWEEKGFRHTFTFYSTQTGSKVDNSCMSFREKTREAPAVITISSDLFINLQKHVVSERIWRIIFKDSSKWHHFFFMEEYLVLAGIHFPFFSAKKLKNSCHVTILFFPLDLLSQRFLNRECNITIKWFNYVLIELNKSPEKCDGRLVRLE